MLPRTPKRSPSPQRGRSPQRRRASSASSFHARSRSHTPLPAVPTHSSTSSAESVPAADLQAHLEKIVALLEREKKTSPGGPPRDKGIVRIAQTALELAEQSEEDLSALKTQLAEQKKDAAENYFDAVAPLMRDMLLRYIANDKYRKAIVNHSINPTSEWAFFHHYALPRDVVTAVESGRLSPEIGADLLEVLQKHETHGRKPTYRSISERNDAAHPTGLNNRFYQYAQVLEAHQPGWIKAYQQFVNTPKARYEDELSNEYYRDDGREAEPYPPASDYNVKRAKGQYTRTDEGWASVSNRVRELAADEKVNSPPKDHERYAPDDMAIKKLAEWRRTRPART